MSNTPQENVVFGLTGKSKKSLCYFIAGLYVNEDQVEKKEWHALMWTILSAIGQAYSNKTDDPRPTFTTLDSDKIRAFTNASEFEVAYPQVAKIAKAKANLMKPQVQTSPEIGREALDLRLAKLEQLILSLTLK